MVSWDWIWEWGMTVNVHKLSFWVNENVLKLTLDDNYTTIILLKIIEFHTSKYVFPVSKLYLDKAIKKDDDDPIIL